MEEWQRLVIWRNESDSLRVELRGLKEEKEQKMKLKGLYLYLRGKGEPPESFEKWTYRAVIFKISTVCGIYWKRERREAGKPFGTFLHDSSRKATDIYVCGISSGEDKGDSVNYKIWAKIPFNEERTMRPMSQISVISKMRNASAGNCLVKYLVHGKYFTNIHSLMLLFGHWCEWSQNC